jgi:Kef-type K+ transport system membrane component KefB/predicted amino acid-binding ACT domain protein
MDLPLLLAVEQTSTLGQLAGLLAIVACARIASELAERIGLPGVLAEIAAGVILGPSVLGVVEPGEAIHLLAEIGAILLLFEVGLHMDIGDLKRVGPDAGRVAIIGVVLPGLAIWSIAAASGIGSDAAIFLGAAVTATSVGITARVFADMKVLASVEARTVLGAAVADDVLALLVLTFVTQTVGGADATRSIGATIALAIGFIVVGGAIAVAGAPRFFDLVARHGRTEGALVVGTVAFALAFASVGAWAGLAPLIGAFIAGIAAARSDRSAEFQRRIAPVGQVIVPIFFVSVGLSVDVGAFADPSVLGLAALVTIAAVVTKIVAGVGMRAGRGDRILVGLGMVPRGEVGLIFAALGLSSGVLDERDHAALVLVMLLTTVVTPPLLRLRLRRRDEAAEVAGTPGTGGEVRIDAGTVSLDGTPSPDDALVTVLQLARAASDHRVDPSVVTWLRTGPIDDVGWDDRARLELFRLLRVGRDRSFRLLETTGVFAGLFPGIAAEARHAVDPYGLEGESTWERLLELQSLLRDPADTATYAYESLQDPHLLLLVALSRGAFGDADAATKARALASSIGLKWQEAEEIGELVSERLLLPAAALEPDLGDRAQLLELAAHLGTDRKATSLYVLAVAEHRRDRDLRARLDALYELIHAQLTDQTRGEGVDLIEARRQAVRRIADGLPPELVLEHLDDAPHRYLLTTLPETVALHLQMTNPMPGPDEARLHVTSDDTGRAQLHFVFRDRHGALASLAQLCLKHRLAIRDASASVWSNGIAITTFLLDASPDQIDHAQLRGDAERALRVAEAMETLGRVDGHVSIDNHASPWTSIVEVRAPDRAGLLAKVAAAISAIGAEIVSASATTTEGVARDRFLVQSGDGGKLSSRDERALRQTLATGKRPTRLGARR